MKHRPSLLLSRATAALFTACVIIAGTTAARADRCDDLAKQLTSQIDGLQIRNSAGGAIFFRHSAVKQASLGCMSQTESNSFYATSEKRKPPEAFYELMATAAALIFTIPKPDALRGTKRCTGRIGFIRGYNIVTRYRKLDIRCSGSKAGLSVTISRDKNV